MYVQWNPVDTNWLNINLWILNDMKTANDSPFNAPEGSNSYCYSSDNMKFCWYNEHIHPSLKRVLDLQYDNISSMCHYCTTEYGITKQNGRI